MRRPSRREITAVSFSRQGCSSRSIEDPDPRHRVTVGPDDMLPAAPPALHEAPFRDGPSDLLGVEFSEHFVADVRDEPPPPPLAVAFNNEVAFNGEERVPTLAVAV